MVRSSSTTYLPLCALIAMGASSFSNQRNKSKYARHCLKFGLHNLPTSGTCKGQYCTGMAYTPSAQPISQSKLAGGVSGCNFQSRSETCYSRDMLKHRDFTNFSGWNFRQFLKGGCSTSIQSYGNNLPTAIAHFNHSSSFRYRFR